MSRRTLLQKIGGGSNLPIDDLFAAYRFENNGNDSINGYNGTPTSISYVAGLVGQAANFSASTSSQFSVADNDAFTFNRPISISCLVYVNANARFTIATKGTGTAWRIFYNSVTGRISYQKWDSANTGFLSVELGLFDYVTTLDWFHLCITDDNSNTVGGMKFYIDGAEIPPGTTTATGTYVSMVNNTAPMLIGKLDGSTGWSLDGLMDELFYWDLELTDAQVLELATEQLAGVNILA